MPRRPIGERAMTAAERQQKRRLRLAAEDVPPDLPPGARAAADAYKRLPGLKRDAFLRVVGAVRVRDHRHERAQMIARIAELQWKLDQIEPLFGREVIWPKVNVRVGGCGGNNYWITTEGDPQLAPLDALGAP